MYIYITFPIENFQNSKKPVWLFPCTFATSHPLSHGENSPPLLLTVAVLSSSRPNGLPSREAMPNAKQRLPNGGCIIFAYKKQSKSAMYLGKVKTFFLFFVVIFERKLSELLLKMVIIMVESKTSPDTNPIWFRDFLEAQKPTSIFLSFFLEDSLRLNNHRVMRLAVWSPDNLKMDGWNANFLLGWPIFMGYLSFGECIKSSNLVIKLTMTLGYVAHWF